MTTRDTTRLLPLPRDDGWRRSWRDWAWMLGFGAVQWPWLLRSLSAGSPAVRADLLARLGLPASALPHLGSWKADAHFLAALVDHVVRLRPAAVVELGAGATTLVLARALALHGGGALISLDQHDDFIEAVRGWLTGHGLSADLRAAALEPRDDGWPGPWYAIGALPDRIDLLVIDGPCWALHPLVRGHAETLFGRLPVGGVVLMDDAARPGERIVAQVWRRRWPGFEFHRLPGPAGTLVGVRRR